MLAEKLTWQLWKLLESCLDHHPHNNVSQFARTSSIWSSEKCRNIFCLCNKCCTCAQTGLVGPSIQILERNFSFQTKHNRVKNPKWQEAGLSFWLFTSDKCSRRVELGCLPPNNRTSGCQVRRPKHYARLPVAVRAISPRSSPEEQRPDSTERRKSSLPNHSIKVRLATLQHLQHDIQYLEYMRDQNSKAIATGLNGVL